MSLLRPEEEEVGRRLMLATSQKTCHGRRLRTLAEGQRKPPINDMNIPFLFSRQALAGLLLGLYALGTGAATPPDSLLREATVVGQRREALSSASPRYELKVDRLAQEGAATMSQLLRRLPGVNLRDYGGAGGLKTVSVRGLGAAHTAVSLDGLPVSDAQSGQVDFRRFGAAQLQELSLQVADQSSLLTPARSLNAAHLALRTAHTGRRVALEAGSFGHYAVQTLWSGRTGAHGWTAAGEATTSRNDYPFTLRNHRLVTHERREHSDLQSANVATSYRYTPQAGTEVAAQAGYYAMAQNLPGMVVYYTRLGTEDLTEQQAYAQLRWQHHHGRWQWMAAGKLSRNHQHYQNHDGQYPGGLLSLAYTQREGYATAGASYDIGGGWAAAYATDATLQGLSSNQPNDNDVVRTTWLHALSLRYERGRWQATVRTLGHLSWNRLAATTDAATAEDVQRLSPSATLSFRPAASRHGQWRWRLYYKEHFRLPTFTENYYYHLGNTRLRPETTRQWGVGTSFAATPRGLRELAQLSVDVYYNRIADRITAIPYNLYIWRMTNVGRVEAIGLDLVAALRWRMAQRHALDLSANYSLQSVVDRTDSEGDSYGKQQAYTPVHSLAWAARWDNPWCSVGLTLLAASERWSTHNHVEETRLAPYADLQAAVQKTFSLGRGQRLDFNFTINNLTHHQYDLVRFYPMPGRAWRVKAVYHF